MPEIEPIDVDLAEIEDPAAQAAAQACMEKMSKAQLFAFEVRGKTHIGRVANFKELTALGLATGKGGAKVDHTNVAFIQKFLVWPTYSQKDLLYDLPGGRALKILSGLSAGSEVPGSLWEDEIKNLLRPPEVASEV